MCRHCKVRVALHGKRGLCWKDYNDPLTRSLYRCLPTGRTARQDQCMNRDPSENTATMTLEELEAFIEKQYATMPLDDHPHDVLRKR